MVKVEFQYILLALLGMIIHILMHINQRRNKNIPTSVKIFLADKINWVRIFLSLTSIVSLLLMADDVANILGVTLSDGSPAKSLFAFLSGYMNHSIIRNVLKIFNKK